MFQLWEGESLLGGLIAADGSAVGLTRGANGNWSVFNLPRGQRDTTFREDFEVFTDPGRARHAFLNRCEALPLGYGGRR